MPRKSTARKKRAAKGASKARRRPSAKKRAAKKPSPPAPQIPVSALEVEWRPVAKLRPSRNARTHSPEQIALIAGSITEFGWMNPPIVDGRGRILAGHGRWEAAKLLGLSKIPTIPATHLTARQKRSYVLADNRLAELAGWDLQILATELGDLAKMGADLGVLGWSPDEVRETIAAAGATLRGRTGPDDAPPAPDVAFARAGDLWALGQHRLLCGDCTIPADVSALLESRRAPVMMVTDPPYGVSYDPAWRERSGLAGAGKLATGKVTNDDRADWTDAWKLFPGDVAYVWHAGTKAHIVSASLAAASFEIRAQIVWVKPRFVISRGAYHVQHEPAFYATRKGLEDDRWQERDEQPDQADGLDAFDRFSQDQETALYAVREKAAARYRGGRKQSTVWNIEHLKSDTGHGTQKPVDAMKRPVENNSAPGDAIYEPFLGSGTTMIAAEMTGRICYAIEVEPRYVDVAVRRWQEFTGKQAVLEATGQTWDEITEERADAESA